MRRLLKHKQYIPGIPIFGMKRDVSIHINYNMNTSFPRWDLNPLHFTVYTELSSFVLQESLAGCWWCQNSAITNPKYPLLWHRKPLLSNTQELIKGSKPPNTAHSHGLWIGIHMYWYIPSWPVFLWREPEWWWRHSWVSGTVVWSPDLWCVSGGIPLLSSSSESLPVCVCGWMEET